MKNNAVWKKNPKTCLDGIAGASYRNVYFKDIYIARHWLLYCTDL